VYESEIEAWRGIKAKEFNEGEVIVVRYEGLVGGPGMPEESNLAWFLQDKGFRKSVYLVTDARFSGGQSGQCIGMVSPEAALGGPIGLVRNGDRVRIHIQERKLDLLVDEHVLERRRKDWKKPEPRYRTGYLARYAHRVSSPGEGAVLRPRYDQ
jgi:dihydroxy-acid dehydratase